MINYTKKGKKLTNKEFDIKIENSNFIRLSDYINTKTSKLVKEGADPKLTGNQIMNERGSYKIWGCGQIRWKYLIT